MKLISHTEYEDLIDLPTVSDSEFRIKSRNYRKFLKQPLELWMFVAVGENSNVLEEPCKQCTDNCKCLDRIKYQKAKERCLFDGVEYIEAKKEGNFSFLRITELSTINYPNFWNGHTIEDLVKYNLELTPTAIKTLGL